MTKYASNVMLAARISMMNEIANVCERVGADVEMVRQGVGRDSRIGSSFLFPGIGYGGSCFPKDVRALATTALQHGYDMLILNAVERVNEIQKQVLVHKIVTRFGEDLDGFTAALWGLSFKPRTDDMREAPSLVIVEELVKRGAKVVAHDPAAENEARTRLGDKVTISKKRYDTLDGADFLIIATEWNEFREPDFDELKSRLKNPVIFDGRNLYDPASMARRGFEYFAIGRGDSIQA